MDSLSTRTKKRNQTIINKYGSMEAYKEEARKWGKQGDKSNAGWTKLTFEQRSKAGKKGNAAMRAKLKEELLNELREEGHEV